MLSTSTGSAGRSRRISFSRSSPLAPGSVRSSTTTSQTSFRIRTGRGGDVARLADDDRLQPVEQDLPDAVPHDRVIVDQQNADHTRAPPTARSDDGDQDVRAFAGLAVIDKLAADQLGALAHAEQPDRRADRRCSLPAMPRPLS